MAKIFPRIEDIDGLPFSEEVVYKALMSLPDTFTIFHSVQWLTEEVGSQFGKKMIF